MDRLTSQDRLELLRAGKSDPDPTGRMELLAELDRSPEKKRESQAIVAADRRIAKVVQAVPVPADLAEKVQQRLSQAGKRQAVMIRRVWIGGSIAVLAAAVMVSFAIFYPRPDQSWTRDLVGRRALECFDNPDLLLSETVPAHYGSGPELDKQQGR